MVRGERGGSGARARARWEQGGQHKENVPRPGGAWSRWCPSWRAVGRSSGRGLSLVVCVCVNACWVETRTKKKVKAAVAAAFD